MGPGPLPLRPRREDNVAVVTTCEPTRRSAALLQLLPIIVNAGENSVCGKRPWHAHPGRSKHVIAGAALLVQQLLQVLELLRALGVFTAFVWAHTRTVDGLTLRMPTLLIAHKLATPNSITITTITIVTNTRTTSVRPTANTLPATAGVRAGSWGELRRVV